MIAMAYPTTRKQALLEMFMDRTAGESTVNNRLVTRMDNGNVALIAYGWLKLAEYNESRGVVTVFTGHQALRSKTVSRWLNQVISLANERGREIVISGESPTVDTPNEGAQFIGDYVSMDGAHSSVERSAVETVVQSLTHLG